MKRGLFLDKLVIGVFKLIARMHIVCQHVTFILFTYINTLFSFVAKAMFVVISSNNIKKNIFVYFKVISK